MLVPSAADTKKKGRLCLEANLNSFLVTCSSSAHENLSCYRWMIRSLSPHIIIDIDLVADQDARDILTVFPQFLIPVRQVLIRDLPRHVEHQDAAVGTVVV